MDFYKLSESETLKAVNSESQGLTEKEAARRLEKNGENKLTEKKKQSFIVSFLKQLADPMIIILIVAAAISLALTLMQKTERTIEDFADVIIIVAVVLLNAFLGVMQEGKAERALEALKTLTEAKCRVLRDGKTRVIESKMLVTGDVVLLEAGDAVPADCRILEAASLKAEESALTGESVPVDKFSEAISEKAALGDRKNMLFSGSTIAYGRAKAVVVGTAMDTEMGKIAHVLNTAKEEKTPLQIKMAGLSKILTYIVIGISAVIFLVNLIKSGFASAAILDSFMIAVGLAVAAIPEGLATTVTIVLSAGVSKMSEKNAVIKKLTAVETLGCAEIICSDKTGTLTKNQMTVTEIYGDKNKAARAFALCSDAELSEGKAVGEATECALVNYAFSAGIVKNEEEKLTPRVGEAPFDSMRKMMSTFHKTENGFVQYVKGAPDVVLSKCSFAEINGEILPMSEEIKAQILAENKKMADKALRVLAAAYKNYEALPANLSPERVETELTFIGLAGMIDPVRPEVKDAIKECRRAGIRPIMITGDHIDTAVAIGKELGIIKSAKEALLGAALDDMTDEELAKNIDKYSVYARVQPEHKVRIVNAWKKRGKICAMTGDGVNDAPSIKCADIGVGMGITGTEVTKSAADMILTDDNFATIVVAVGEGRRIYDNIRKAVQFLLSSNLAEVLAVFIASLCGFTLLLPSHLLWINLVTDCFPAIALGIEPAEKDVMDRPPRLKTEGIFADGLGVNVFIHGIMLAAITLAAYFIGASIEHHGVASEQGMTMAFLTLSMAEIFHAYNVRSMKGSVFMLKTHNKLLWGAMISSLILTTAVIFVPGINAFFHFADAAGNAIINFKEYVIALALAVSVIPLAEVIKAIERAIKKNKKAKLGGKN